MKDPRLDPDSPAHGVISYDARIAADTDVSASSYASTVSSMPVESLEVHDQPVKAQVSAPMTDNRFRSPFSKRKAAVVSSIITVLVVLLTGGALAVLSRESKQPNPSSRLNLSSQDVQLKNQSNATAPAELQGVGSAVLINGDLITRGQLKVTNGAYVTVLRSANLTSNRNLTLPNASGTLCVDSNNCGYATAAQLQDLQSRLGQIVVPTIPDATTVNGLGGAVSVQGTSNQISVTTANGVIALSTPQDIAPISSPTFANLLLNGNFSVAGTVTLPLNCSGMLNGGALTTNASGQIICSADDSTSGGGGGAVSTPGGSAGKLALFTAADTIADSVISQALGAITIGGNTTISGSLSANSLTLATALSVANGGTGATTFTTNGVLLGNGTGAVSSTTAPTAGQVLLGNASNVPQFTTVSGDVVITAAGVTAIQADSVALGVDTTGNYIASLGTLTGLSATGNTGEGSTPTLSVVYGSTANTAVQGNTSMGVIAGTNLVGGGFVTLGSGGGVTLNVSSAPTFSGNVTVQGGSVTIGTTSALGSVVLHDGNGQTGSLATADLTTGRTYTFPDATGTVCLSTGNCVGSGGGAPNSATYLTIGNDGTLANERAIAAGTNIGFTDGGANGNFTISTVSNPNFSTSVTTPLLQSSGALSITPSGALTVGATGQTALLQGSTTTITSNGVGGDIVLTTANNITLTGFNCATYANGGVLTTNASGNITCADDDGGAGGAVTGTGTNGRIALFTGSQTMADSWLLQNGSTLELDNTRNLSLLGGNLSVTGTGGFTGLLTASGGLTVTSGQTFTVNGDAFTDLTGTGLVISSGSLQATLGTSVDLASEITGTLGVTNGGTGVNGSTAANGQLLIGNGTGYTLATLTPGAGITITNGSGSITVANAFGSSVDLGAETTGNYQAGTTAGNGISVSGTAGAGWSAGVALGDLTSNWTQNGAFDIVLNNANSQLKVLESAGGTYFGTIDVGDLTADRTYTFPDASGTICLTSGNCAGAGGGITGSGTTDTIAKFTSGGGIGDSSISDDGSVVTLNGTANLVVQGGTATFGTLTQAGTLTISDGSSNTVSIVASAFAGNQTYTIPDVGGAATFCMSTGNCVGGGGGGAPNDAAYLVATLNGTLTNERALAAGSNISLTDGGAGASFTVATVQNPTFTTSVTTPQLQSSGVLTLTSAAGQVIAVDAGTTIELQDSTNVTGSVDVSVALNVGTADAFKVDSAGSITAATGVTSSGTITFSAFDCTTFANGGKLTTNASGQLVCANDNGAAGGTVTGTGTTGTLPIFSASNVISDSIVTQSGTTVNIAGDLTLNTALSVANGGTGGTSFTANGLLYGNAGGALQVTAAGTSGQVLVANASGVPTFVSFSGDVTVAADGTTTIAADSVALGTDTTGNYVSGLTAGTGVSVTGVAGEGWSPTVSVNYGSTAGTAVEGNKTIVCPSGTGNLSGGGETITLGTGGTCGNLDTIASPTFGTSVTTPQIQSSGALSITSLGALTVGSTAQAFTLQGNSSSTITATGGDGFVTTVGFTGVATGAVTYQFDRTATPGTYTICTTVGNCSGTAATLQSAYNASTNPEIVVDSTRGALTVRDNSTPLTGGANLLEVQNNAGTVTYLGVNAAGASITGNLNIAGTGNNTDVTLVVRGNGSQGGSDLITDFRSYDGVTTKSVLRVTNDAGLFIGNNTGTAARFGISNGTYYGVLQTTNLTSSQTYELPNVSGTICTSAGNCGSTTGTLQAAYNYSVGGTTPEIKLNNPQASLDIQDADTTLGSGANFLSFRAPNAAGLGTLLVGFGLQGNLYMNPSTDRTDFWDINDAGGNNLFTLDSSSKRVGINLGGSNLPSYTLDVGGTARISGATLIQPATNVANALDVKNDVGASVLTVDTSSLFVRVSGAGTDAGITSGTGAVQIGADNGANLALDNNEIMARSNGAASTLLLQQEGGGLNSRANTTVFRNFADSTTALQVQNASGNAILTVDTTNRGVGINAGATGALTVTSDLSLGARSGSLLSVSQANDATNNSTAPLVSFSNADTASGVSVLDLTQGNGNATALQFNANLNSGSAIRISGNGSNTPNANVSFATGSSPFSGSYINVNPARHLTSGTGTYTESGNFLSLSRSNFNDTASGTYAITGDLATLSSNCTPGTGTCTDTSSILSLNQQYANASGAVLKVQGAGTGYLVQVTDTTAASVDVFTIANEGATVFRNRTNSATAFQIQNAAGATMLNVDTTNGRATLSGGGTKDITAQDNTAANGTANSLTIAGADQTSSTCGTACNGGALSLQGGNATGSSGTRNGGSVVIDAGTGATSNGVINIGTNTSANVTIGRTSGGAAVVLQAGSGGVTLEAGGTSTTGKIQIGAGGVGSNTPDYLVLDVKSTAGDPAGGSNGSMYYNANTNKFRCYQNGVWVDCISPTGASTTLQQAYDASTNPEIVLGSTATSGLTVRDNATPISGGNLFEVQSNNGGITYLGVSSSGATVGGLLTVQGSIQMTGASTSSYTTPGASPGTFNARLNVGNADPGSNGMIIGAGLTSSAQTTARGISLFDARTVAHSQTLAVFSPDENRTVGLTWNGSNTSAQVATNDTTTRNSGDITLQSGGVTSGTGLSTGNVSILSGTGTGTNTSTGNITIDSGAKSGTGINGTISIGTANASSITIGNTTNNSAITLQSGTGTINIGTGAAARTINLGTGAANQTVMVGSLTGASTTTIQGGTGNINLNVNQAGAGVIVRTLTADSSSAFQVQRADGNTMLNVDTANGWVINNGSTHPGNLIENPSFEGGSGYTATGWNFGSQSTVATDSTNAHAGNKVLTTTPNGTLIVLSSYKYLAVTPGDQFYAEIWYKTAAGTDGGSNGGSFSFTYYDKDKVSVGSSSVTNFNAANNSYTRATVSGTVPAGATYLRLSTAVNSTSTTGTWYMDDFYMAKMSQQAPVVFANSVDSTTAFQIQNASAATLLAVDTTNGLVQIGSSTTDASARLFALDSFNGADESSFTGAQNVNGAMYYNSNLGKFRCRQGGTWVDCVSPTGASTTLQQAYNFSTGGTTPEITLDTTRGALTVRDNSTPIGANLFEVQNNAGSTTYLGVTTSGTSITGTLTVSGTINGSTLSNSGASTIVSGNATNINLNPGTTGAVNVGGSAPTIQASGNFKVYAPSGLLYLTGGAGSGVVIDSDVGAAGGVGIANSKANSVTIATNDIAHTISIGNGGSTTGQTVQIGSTSSASILTLQGGTGASAMQLNVGTGGTLSIGNNATNKTINMGATGSTANTTTVNIATSTGAAQTVTVGSTNTTSSTTIQGGTNGITLQTAGTTLVTSTSTTAPAMKITQTLGTSTSGGQALLVQGDTATGSTNTFEVQTLGGTQLFAVNADKSRTTIGSDANGNCTGRLCVSQSTGVEGGAAQAVNNNSFTTNLYNYQSVNVTTGGFTPTFVGQNIVVKDTSATQTTILRPLIIDTTSSTNSSAQINAIQVLNRSGNSGTALQLRSGTLGAGTDFLNISNTGQATYRMISDSATAFQIQDSAAASLFTVDTSARSASGGNLIKIGNSTGTDGALTILQLDSATADPTSNLAALNGGLYYNSTTNKVQIIENGVVKELCNKVDTGCGAAGPSLGKNLAVAETSTSNFAGTMYTFTQQNTGAAGVLSLANAGTSSTLRVTATSNASTNNALLFGQLTNASLSGNLLDLRSGSSGFETSKFSVSALGATAVQGTVTVTGLAGASGTSGTAASDVMSITGGTGGTATTGTGGAGGRIVLQTGTGGDSDNVGGNGGLFTVQTGAGGVDNSGFGTGGNGGAVTIATGTGGSSNSGVGGNGGTLTLQAGGGGFSTTTGGSGGDIVLKPGAGSGIGSNGRVQIGSIAVDSIQYNLVVDTSNATSDTGLATNGAIYYNAGGKGGADGGTVYSGKFRCFEGNIWKNCIGMRDIVERRWGYAVPQGLGTALSADGLYTSTILGAASDGAIANSPQAESNYISYSTGTTNGQKGGIGYSHSSTAMQSRWLPKLATRIRVDSTTVASARYWVALAGNTLAGSSPTATSGAFATAYMGVAVDSGINSSKFICGSGDGSTHSGTDMGVTVTAGHYYDIIVDYSTSGTLICSVADNGGAFTTVTKTTNLPSTSTSLGIEETVTTLTGAIRAIHIAYSYLEFQ